VAAKKAPVFDQEQKTADKPSRAKGSPCRKRRHGETLFQWQIPISTKGEAICFSFRNP